MSDSDNINSHSRSRACIPSFILFVLGDNLSDRRRRSSKTKIYLAIITIEHKTSLATSPSVHRKVGLVLFFFREAQHYECYAETLRSI